MSTAEEIPALSFILEPAIVASLLTAGAVFNRRKSQDIVRAHQFAEAINPPLTDDAWNWKEMRLLIWTVRVPDTARFRMKLASRFLGMFPFLMEVWYWLLTYWTYQIARAMQALTMGQNTRALSEVHARQIIKVEQWLGIDVELGLQKIVMAHPWVLAFFNKTYAMVHIPATIAFMGYAYSVFHPQIFQATRRTLVLSNCLAFIIFSSWPCMPPRLLPKDEFSYVDTLHVGKAASIWTTNKFQNQLAAFPSLHFGYSFVIGLSLWAYSPHKIVRIIAPAYPVLILLVIMSTANHFILDAVGGFFVSMLAYRINRLLLNLRPIEEWFFWALRTEKPMDKAQYLSLLNGGSDSHLSDAQRTMAQRPLMSGRSPTSSSGRED